MEGRHFNAEERELLLKVRSAIRLGVDLQGHKVKPNSPLYEDEIYYGLHIDDLPDNDFSRFLYDAARRGLSDLETPSPSSLPPLPSPGSFDSTGQGLRSILRPGGSQGQSGSIPGVSNFRDRRTFPLPPPGNLTQFHRQS